MTPQQHREIVDRLARIETKIDGHGTLEPRLRKVEQRQYYLAGGGSMIGALIALLVKGHAG